MQTSQFSKNLFGKFLGKIHISNQNVPRIDENLEPGFNRGKRDGPRMGVNHMAKERKKKKAECAE